MLNKSIDITSNNILIAWIEIDSNNNTRSSVEHACDLCFPIVTKVLPWFLHSATAVLCSLHFSVFAYASVFCNYTSGISNQWKGKRVFWYSLSYCLTNWDFSSPCVPKVTPALIDLVLAGDYDSTSLPLTHLPLFHSYKINRIFRKE